MDDVEIDVIGAKTLQAVVDFLKNSLSRQAPSVGSFAHRRIHFGRDDDLVAFGEIADGAAHQKSASSV